MTMPNNVVDAGWTPEPELRENPPRRIVAYEDFPDLNKPNLTVVLAVCGAVLVLGFVLLIVGLSKGAAGLSVLGVVLALAGVGMGIFFQQRVRAHVARAEHLVENGVPVIARILSADNMTGSSTYGRFVKYQVVTPGGDMVHRQVNVDDRALPRRIPADATALLDMNSGDVELYCALPFRAISKTAIASSYTPSTPATSGGTVPAAASASVQTDPLAGLPTETAPANASGTMGTISGGGAPRRPAAAPPTPPPPTPAPVATQTQEQKQEQSQEQTPKKTGSSGLPWE